MLVVLLSFRAEANVERSGLLDGCAVNWEWWSETLSRSILGDDKLHFSQKDQNRKFTMDLATYQWVVEI